MSTNLKRIHYSGGLSQDRFLENGGGRRKPTLLRVRALMGDESQQTTRTFGLVLELEPEENSNDVKPVPAVASRPILIVVPNK